jgi:putative FmdB family regulatory protein
MPTYEYRCKDCDHRFDIQQAFTDDALTTCPECGGTLKKVFGNVGITFKGSGFYKTDSRSGSSTGSSSADKASSDKTSSDKGSTSSDKTTSSDKGSSSSDKTSSDKGSTSSTKSSTPAGTSS